jgi:chromosome segregation ATPase
MATDSRLQSLQRELEDLHKTQVNTREEIARLQKTLESKIDRLRSEYGSDIQSLERKYTASTGRIPDITRQINTRQNEIDREQQRNAANTNGASPVKRSSWL